jgi:hypothetical protein
LNSSDPYLASLGRDLVLYDYFTSHFAYTARSWSSYIPVDYLESQGFADAAYQIEERLKIEGIRFYSDLADMFARNNWANPEIVPAVRTYYSYDATGQRIVKTDEKTGEIYDSIDTQFFDWDSHANTQRYFSVPKALLNKESMRVKNSRYLLLQNQQESVLFKRVIFEDAERNNLNNEEVEGYVYFYPVSKLGSRVGGIEINDETMYVSNEVGFDMQAYQSMLADFGTDVVVMSERIQAQDGQNIQCNI